MNNGKICVSVCAETASEFIEKIERAAEVADVIELRLDCLAENEFATVLYDIENLRQKTQKPFLATFRPKSKEAEFVFGKRINLSKVDKERIRKATNERNLGWEKILSSNEIDWVDFEVDLHLSLFIDLLFKPKFSRILSESALENLKAKMIILSEHNFEKMPQDFDIAKPYEDIFFIREFFEDSLGKSEALEEIRIAAIKIAAQAYDATDGLTLMKLLADFKIENKVLIPIAMGEHGIWTRILGLSRGAFMTFASLDERSATAPGQLTAQEMIDVYRVKELDENTEVYGLAGGSVTHSVSPQMHNAAFKFHGLNAVYVPFAVKNLEEFMRRMVNPKTREIDWHLRGLSVTIPHKIEIMQYLDFIDETAKQIGAVNTIKIEGDKLYGFNTDAAGFIEPLKNSYGSLRNAKVAVLGAGGAARAVVYALKNECANVTVFARNVEKARTLEQDFSCKTLELTDYELQMANYDVVVNATPLGMKKGGLENQTPLTAAQLEGVGLVYDLVYNPFETRLIKEAQAVFVPTVGGLAMLVAQAMEQQKIWTGLDAPMKEMSAAALRKL